MKKKYCVILFVVLLFIFSAQLTASADISPNTATMNEISSCIDRNWLKWSGNESTLNAQQLIDNLTNPAYTGKDAAALAALAYYVKEVFPDRQLSLDDIHNIISRDEWLSSYYDSLKKSLRTITHQIYKSGHPNFEVMQQGPIGNCFFFSGVGWLVKYRPQVIERAIIRLPNNKYQVNFPDGNSVIVNTPTESEILFFSSPSTSSDGFWMLILEKAFGMVYPDYDTHKFINIDEPMENIDNGGFMVITQKIWTGGQPNLYELSKTGMESIREKLIDMKNNNLMAQAVVDSNPPVPVAKAPAFGTGHAYAVLDFDEKTNLLTMWNPWGTDFKPAGPDNPQNGYTRTKGIFKIPFADFMSVYCELSIEHSNK